jgi:hypothetical protein
MTFPEYMGEMVQVLASTWQFWTGIAGAALLALAGLIARWERVAGHRDLSE